MHSHHSIRCVPCLVPLAIALAPPPAPAQAPVPVVAEDQFVFDVHGRSGELVNLQVSASGDTLVVGAERGRLPGLSTEAGKVQVFVRGTGGWIWDGEIFAGAPQNGARFGCSVSVQNDRLAVGSYFADATGRVHVFERVGSGWTETASFVGHDTSDHDAFGDRVALDGDTLLASARYHDGAVQDAGAAYVFVFDGVAWLEQARLETPLPASNDDFACALDVDGDLAVVGARADDRFAPDGGAVYVYERSGSSWGAPVVLGAEAAGYDSFGTSLDVEGDRLAVGAPGYWTSAVLVYERQGGAWQLDTTLTPTDAEVGTEFGASVALEGDRLVVAAPDDDVGGPFSGQAYVFERRPGGWVEVARLLNGAGGGSIGFARHVAASAGRVFVGSWRADGAVPDSGGVYAYESLVPVARSFCFGDGSGLPCPCGNESLPGAGEGCARDSTTAVDGTLLYAFGSASVSADDFGVCATNLGPIGTLIALWASTGRHEPGYRFHRGLWCLGEPRMALGVRLRDEGSVTWQPTGAPWAAGDTWHLQAVYRDVTTVHCTALGINTSNALAVTFGP